MEALRAESGRIRAMIADDHAMVREGLRSMLRDTEIEVVGEAATGREAIRLARELRPDVVLLDVRMPDLDGLAALSVIKRDSPETAVLMVTTYEASTYLVRAIAAGASGYLLKGLGREELVRALKAVCAGEPVIDPGMLRAVLDNVPTQADVLAPPPEQVSLTDREIEVLSLVARGLTNHQIGEALYITEGTARVHVHNILKKIGVSDRTQAAVWAAKYGLLDH